MRTAVKQPGKTAKASRPIWLLRRRMWVHSFKTESFKGPFKNTLWKLPTLNWDTAWNLLGTAESDLWSWQFDQDVICRKTFAVLTRHIPKAGYFFGCSVEEVSYSIWGGGEFWQHQISITYEKCSDFRQRWEGGGESNWLCSPRHIQSSVHTGQPVTASHHLRFPAIYKKKRKKKGMGKWCHPLKRCCWSNSRVGGAWTVPRAENSRL